jgi:chromosome segregation ATPase
MSDEVQVVPARDTSGALLIALGLSLVLAIAALIWCYALSNHLTVAEQKLASAEQKNQQLANQQEALGDRLRATTETLGQSVGLTQKQIELRTQTLMAAQAAAARANAAQAAKLEEAQKAEDTKIGAVQTDVSTVKTDVGGAKASIAETQNDLAQTKTQLQRTIGDQGVMSGLIARTHDELETLKHRGDRNYYEFTLQKGAKPSLLSTVKLQAKKVDDKKGKYTLIVSSDDRNIEKKDKTLDEPVQFYSGKDAQLFEIVVNNISKNQISGYLATPKSAPQPIEAPSKN